MGKGMLRTYSIFNAQQDLNIQEAELPYLPDEIEFSHLFSNGKLLPEDKINEVIKWFKENPSQIEFDVPPEWQHKDTVFEVEEWADERGRYNGGYKIKKQIGYKIVRFIDKNAQQFRYGLIYQKKDFEKGLGEGHAGTVQLIQDLVSGEYYASKRRAVGSFSDNTIEKIEYEINMLHKLHFLIGVVKTKNKYNDEEFLLMMKLARGKQLSHFIQNNPDLSTMHWIDIAIEILRAAEIIHEMNILHRDIKPENLVLDWIGRILTIVDFDLALLAKVLHDENNTGGTFGFVASKSASKGKYDESTEVYALGKTLGILFDLVKEKGELFARKYKLFNPEKITNHKKIPLKLIRDQVIHFIDKMTSKRNIPSIKQSREFFEELQWHFVDVLEKIRSIGVLDLDEYYSLNETKMIELNIALRCMDEVWLLDSENKYKDKYTSIIHEFKELKIPIGTKRFHAIDINKNTKNLPAQIPLVVRTKENEHLNSYYFISTVKVKHEDEFHANGIYPIEVNSKQTEVDYKKSMLEQAKRQHLLYFQFRLVKSSLERKIKKLIQKYDEKFKTVEKRKVLLEDVLKDIQEAYQQNKLSMNFLHEKLVYLQEQMIFAEKIDNILQEQEIFYSQPS